jgi:hypothetical protein
MEKESHKEESLSFFTPSSGWVWRCMR